MLTVIPNYIDVPLRKRVDEIVAENPEVDADELHSDLLRLLYDGSLTLKDLPNVSIRMKTDD